VADERTGEAVEAWVVPRAGETLTPGDVLSHVTGHLARFKMPKVVNVVDDLPHHVTGKILRRALRHPPGEPPPAGSGEPVQSGGGSDASDASDAADAPDTPDQPT
jgi:hypothetical protein